MKADAPGKLILSGEHSVVYGAPAFAVAVSKSVQVQFESDAADSLRIISDRLGKASFNLHDLQAITDQLEQKYAAFLDQKLPIGQVLSSPFELLVYTLVKQGFDAAGTLRINSDIPAGAGMGSSAAVICALIKLARKIQHRPISADQLFQDIRYCERLQHGRGSAIDAAAVAYARPVKLTSGQATEWELDLDGHWYLWNSGTPASSTGESVAAVRDAHADSAIWQEFTHITGELEAALHLRNSEKILECVKANQRLLERIGVVPATVSQQIREIEDLGGAAKICGAGSVAGSSGGMVLIYLPDISAAEVEQQLNISLEPLSQA